MGIFSSHDLLCNVLEGVKVGHLHEFMTSADVVMKASGLRMEAIRSIAREVGVEIENTESRCIDENLLSLLADAHVRQLKSYFNKSRRHISELTGAELSMFVEFCETFKKRQSNNSALSWDNIDVDAIREQFNKKVHSITSSQEFPSKFYGSMILDVLIESCDSASNNHSDLLSERQKDSIISRLLNNRWLYVRCVERHVVPCDRRSQVRRVTLSSRYYIFSDEDYHIAC